MVDVDVAAMHASAVKADKARADKNNKKIIADILLIKVKSLIEWNLSDVSENVKAVLIKSELVLINELIVSLQKLYGANGDG